MKVLVGQSYFLRFDDKLWRAMRPLPPLGSLYAAAVLRDRGHGVAVFDAMLAPSEQAWAEALDRHRPDVAVLFEDNFNYLSKMCLLRMREAAFTMLAMAAARSIPVVVCGSDATDHAAAYLDHGAARVIAGEGEATLVELLDRWPGDGDGGSLAVTGVTLRGSDGALIDTGRRPNLRDLDALPLPARDLIDLHPYREAWRRHGRFSTNVVTTRGCPFHCNWCAKPIWGQRYAVRSPEAVVSEVVMLRDVHGVDHIAFVDDIFGLRPGWLAAYADRVRGAGRVLPFSCLSRADLLVREGEVGALRAAGCEMVWMGAESGAQSVLDAMDKGTRVEQIEEATARLHEAGIAVGFFLQFGYPGEGIDEIAATRDLVRRCRPDDIGISVSYPLPGTPFHERVRDQLGERANWVDSDDLAMLYEGPFSTELYRELHAVVHKEHRLALAGGTRVGPHLRRALRVPPRRHDLGRLRDAVTLRADERRLARRMAVETAARPTALTAPAEVGA